jgi:hypothetical protein
MRNQEPASQFFGKARFFRTLRCRMELRRVARFGIFTYFNLNRVFIRTFGDIPAPRCTNSTPLLQRGACVPGNVDQHGPGGTIETAELSAEANSPHRGAHVAKSARA